MIGVVFKIKCRMPYVWVNFSALTTGSHKKETTHRCNVTYNPTHTNFSICKYLLSFQACTGKKTLTPFEDVFDVATKFYNTLRLRK